MKWLSHRLALAAFAIGSAAALAMPACSPKAQSNPADDPPGDSGTAKPPEGSQPPASTEPSNPPPPAAGATCDSTPGREPNRQYRIKDPAACKAALFQCPNGSKAFFNDCGCGCEQAASCPPSFNCMPGPGSTPCDAEDIKRRCPLSVIAQ